MADGWDNQGSIGKNTGDAPINVWGFYQEVGDVRTQGAQIADCKPGAMWTCPEAGYYAISATFQGNWYVSQGFVVDTLVVKDGASLFASAVTGWIGSAANGYTDGFGDVREVSYTGTVYADAGSTIIFAAGQEPATSGAYGGAAGLDVTITTVPEPSSLAAFATGVTGLLGFVIRRRRS